ncbi:3',5'-cyclic AMP phosphodiesterase CpdA [Mariprofundus aestuarium]|uniref:3',5'-cyclic AMP phosphodiesterase CpdA n=1 Tax=Mariprofundus aestuarium TaxID=1921086 RepID=A0A2K8KXE3_MARES|nr:metallophosphoesterase [Mariprofundus aestuarium]ATX79533.1 3',5'-cyclic AMP phosphodiesterase CpdA [Mariprofundus aestuarium]
MRLQILSDLHIEHAPCHVIQGSADVVILAGDISESAEGILWARDTFQSPVIYVSGNHEYHDPSFSMAGHMEAMRNATAGSNVILLDNETTVIGGVRFLGSTMWTDLSNFGAVLYCDYDNIVVEHEHGRAPIHFSVEQQQMRFDRNLKWLCTELSKPFQGKTVVVTHHAPSLKSLHPQYVGNPWNPCFMSNLQSLMPGVNLWVHGHTHSSFDYQLGSTRVICNPRGYPLPLGGWENPAFDSMLVVEV